MDQPFGTATFLFTDIEGSTGLWEQHPELMQTALALHDNLLRGAVESQGGSVFKTVGDAFCVCFPSATDAVTGALAAQRALLTLAEDEAVPIRVRMALYTGDAEQRGGDYFGAPLNRCARILSAGHGGQILVAATTAAIVRDGLPAAIALRPLGAHRLRDLTAAEDLYQLLHPDLPADFPALRSIEAFPNNLPIQPTRLIGREEDLREVRARLAAMRLLTLTGTGGTGKTRLALQAASDVLEEWPDGVWFVDLAQLSEPSFVDRAVLAALGLHADPKRAVREILLDALRPKRLLLLLDNCEHLIGACAELAEAILSSCPHAAILATSRETLRIAGEVVWRVPSLSVPATDSGPLSPQSLGQYTAVQLFIERATAVRPDFSVMNENAPAVAQICWRLDGIPLAIELAAARLRVLSPDQIAARLDDCFHLLTGGRRTAPTRQQTLRAAIEWSYDLLAEQQQALFWRLSVFAGWFGLEAAEAVGAGGDIETWEVLDLLTELADKSLVLVREDDDGTVYRLLETLRAYAHERLCEVGEEPRARERHAQYYLALAEHEIPDDPHQLASNQRSAKHYNDLRATLEWFTQSEQGFEPGVRLARALEGYWSAAALLDEGRAYVACLLARPDAQAVTTTRAEACWTAAVLALGQADHAAARAWCEQQLQLRRDLGDEEGALAALFLAGITARAQGDQTASRSFSEQHLAWQRERGDEVGIARSLEGLAWQFYWEGDNSRAEELIAEALVILEALGDDEQATAARRVMRRTQAQVREDDDLLRQIREEELSTARRKRDDQAIAMALNEVRHLATGRHDYAAAREYQEECVAIRRRLGDTGTTALALWSLGLVAHEQGDYEQARAAFQEALALYRKVGNKPRVVNTLLDLARTARAQGDEHTARACDEGSLGVWRELGDMRGLGRALEQLGHAAWFRGDHTEARARHEQRLTVWRELGDEREAARALRDIGGASWGLGEPGEAQRVLEESIAIWDRLGDPVGRSYALDLLGLALSDRGDHQRARSVLGEALETYRERKNDSDIANSLSHLGLVAWREGALEEARELQLQCLAYRQQRHDKRGICLSLERLAAVYNSAGDPARAARLFGAAEVLREEMRSPNRGDAFPEHVEVLSAIHDALGDEAFRAAWAEGRAMALQQAVASALGEDTPG